MGLEVMWGGQKVAESIFDLTSKKYSDSVPLVFYFTSRVPTIEEKS